MISNVCRLRFRKENIYPSGTRFSATAIDKKAFLFNFVSNFQCKFNDGCGQVLYIGHSSEKKYSITFFYFYICWSPDWAD